MSEPTPVSTTATVRPDPALRTPRANRPVSRVGGPSTTRLGDELDREWARLRRDRVSVIQAAGWNLVDATLDDLDQVLQAIGFGVPPTHRNEAACRHLATLAPTDDLAARVLFQRLVPGLFAIGRRRRARTDDEVGELIGAAWIAIRSYNPARSPACISAALLRDAEHRTYRGTRRQASFTEQPFGHDLERLPAPEVSDAASELADLFGLAHCAGVPPADLDLLRQLVATERAVDVAVTFDVTPRTIRNRKDRITRRLREVALAA